MRKIEFQLSKRKKNNEVENQHLMAHFTLKRNINTTYLSHKLCSCQVQIISSDFYQMRPGTALNTYVETIKTMKTSLQSEKLHRSVRYFRVASRRCYAYVVT